MTSPRGWIIIPWILLLVNCTVQSPTVMQEALPAEEPKEVEEVADPLPPEPEEVFNADELPTEEESEVLQEEEKMELKPISEFPAYFVDDNGGVFGVEADALIPIDFVDLDGNNYRPEYFGFIDEVVLVGIKTMESGDPIPDTDPVQYEAVEKWHYFEQNISTNSGMISMPPEEWIAWQEPTTITLDAPPFKIESGKSGDFDISTVYQETQQVAFLPVTGALHTTSGLWFYVSETFSIREKGLYFWPIGGNYRKVKESGRLW